jgi:predicted DCC family thiol-disulfide oxidoreductase YuxK
MTEISIMKVTANKSPSYPLHLLYDGACAVCRLEMNELAARDTRGRLALVDISAAGFDPAPWGASLAEMNALIHAVDAAGVTTTGVPALRLAYDAVGLGAWFAPTRWPLLAPLFSAGYRAFARHRYGISRATAPLVDRIAARRARRRAVAAHQRMRACANGACDIHEGSRT